MTVTTRDIRAAAETLKGQAVRTPTRHSRTLSEIAGCEIWLKFENLQYTASFKDRGSYVKLVSLDDAARRAGVIAASAGNHAQGVAYHARRLGIPATIVMPAQTPFNKVRQTEHFGARIVLHGADLAESYDHAVGIADREGLAVIHPYDDPAIVAGQGTAALEMLEDAPDLDALVVPIGGGGLIAGMALMASEMKPGIEIFGAEAALYPAMKQCLAGEEIRTGGATIAEGIAVKRPGAITREIVRKHVSDILLVDEPALENAVLMLLEIEKSVVEGAGAAALAAVLENRARFAGRTVGIVISGGNIDSRILSAILMRGLVRQSRLVRLRIDIQDQPGVLGAVARLIGEAGGNIVEVYHQRLFHNVPLKQAELDIVVETRDADHVEAILKSLCEAGHKATMISSNTGARVNQKVFPAAKGQGPAFMAKGNDGNYLQHCTEVEIATRLAKEGRGLHVAFSHGMMPFEGLGKPNKKIAHERLWNALNEAGSPRQEGERHLVTAFRDAGASEDRYPNSAELVRCVVGTEKMSGGITEIDLDKHRALENAWRGSRVKTARASWRSEVSNSGGVLSCPEKLDRPWLFSMDPMTYVEKGKEDEKSDKLHRSDLDRIAEVLRPYVKSGQPGVASIFVYSVGIMAPGPKIQFWRFIDDLAERVGAKAGYFWLPHIGGNRNLAGLLFSHPELLSDFHPPCLNAGKG